MLWLCLIHIVMSTDGSTNSTHSSVSQGLIVFKYIQNHLPLSSLLFFHVLPLSKLSIHPSIDPFQQTSKKTPKSPRFSSDFPFSSFSFSCFSSSSFYPSLAPLLAYSLPSLLQLLLHFLAHRIEIPMRHRFLRRQSLLPLTLPSLLSPTA